MADLRIAFAGDRDLSVWILKYLLEQQVKPVALMVSTTKNATHADELRELCSFLGDEHVLHGRQFREPEGIAMLASLNLDYVIGIHFPYIVPETVLSVPRIGVINLHPAYLPYNRGWHTPTWALLEGTPVGATLHFMDAGLDTGDIIHQKQLKPSPGETANSLYVRLKQLEFEVFQEAWGSLANKTFIRQKQQSDAGTEHNRKDLFTEEVQKLDLDAQVNTGDLLLRLRGLTTNRVDEAAYYEADGKRYRVQVIIHEEEIEDDQDNQSQDRKIAKNQSTKDGSVLAGSSR